MPPRKKTITVTLQAQPGKAMLDELARQGIERRRQEMESLVDSAINHLEDLDVPESFYILWLFYGQTESSAPEEFKRSQFAEAREVAFDYLKSREAELEQWELTDLAHMIAIVFAAKEPGFDSSLWNFIAKQRIAPETAFKAKALTQKQANDVRTLCSSLCEANEEARGDNAPDDAQKLALAAYEVYKRRKMNVIDRIPHIDSIIHPISIAANSQREIALQESVWKNEYKHGNDEYYDEVFIGDIINGVPSRVELTPFAIRVAEACGNLYEAANKGRERKGNVRVSLADIARKVYGKEPGDTITPSMKKAVFDVLKMFAHQKCGYIGYVINKTTGEMEDRFANYSIESTTYIPCAIEISNIPRYYNSRKMLSIQAMEEKARKETSQNEDFDNETQEGNKDFFDYVTILLYDDPPIFKAALIDKKYTRIPWESKKFEETIMLSGGNAEKKRPRATQKTTEILDYINSMVEYFQAEAKKKQEKAIRAFRKKSGRNPTPTKEEVPDEFDFELSIDRIVSDNQDRRNTDKAKERRNIIERTRKANENIKAKGKIVNWSEECERGTRKLTKFHYIVRASKARK